MDSGVEKVEDDPSRRALVARAHRITLQSLAVGVVITTAALLLSL